MTGFTYDSSSVVGKDLFGSNSVLFHNIGADRYFTLRFASALAGSSGPVALVTGYNGNAGSWECMNCGMARAVTGGSVSASATGAVPEPATWAMMMLGFGGMGHALRRNRKVRARIRFA